MNCGYVNDLKRVHIKFILLNFSCILVAFKHCTITFEVSRGYSCAACNLQIFLKNKNWLDMQLSFMLLESLNVFMPDLYLCLFFCQIVAKNVSFYTSFQL